MELLQRATLIVIVIVIATAIVQRIVMADMLKINRVCIVFGTDCNLHCRYCYRDINKIEEIPNLTNEFKTYLQSLRPEWCTAVCASGGEPLLYFEKIKEVFSCVPTNVHKKIMTNGILLTQEIIDYINENQIELMISHDGEYTEYLRGVDVLKNKEICNLIKQAKILRVAGVATNKNCNLMKNYRNTSKYLNRDDILYFPQAVFHNGCNDYLIEGFDYDIYTKSMIELMRSFHSRENPYYDAPARSNGFNFLLDGSVIGMSTMHKYGTIRDSLLDLIKRKDEHEDSKVCRNTDCSIRKECLIQSQIASKHNCKIEKIRVDISRYFSSVGDE